MKEPLFLYYLHTFFFVTRIQRFADHENGEEIASTKNFFNKNLLVKKFRSEKINQIKIEKNNNKYYREIANQEINTDSS